MYDVITVDKINKNLGTNQASPIYKYNRKVYKRGKKNLIKQFALKQQIFIHMRIFLQPARTQVGNPVH